MVMEFIVAAIALSTSFDDKDKSCQPECGLDVESRH
jgi:hypothetical protein